jgi:sugar lactone lactonase YvrE
MIGSPIRRECFVAIASVATIICSACSSQPSKSATTRADGKAAAYGPSAGFRDVPSRDSGMVAPRQQPAPPPRNAAIAFADSLHEPESVRYDADQDKFFVSNMNGPMLRKDGNGFISRLKSDGTMDEQKWIQSGKNGAKLDAPKGMAIVGDTLWVADIDHARAFNRRTGAVVADIDLSGQGATFLNDIAVGGDSAIYITDTELASTPTGNLVHAKADRIFRIGSDRRATIAVQNDRLSRPNGIIWDASASRFVVVPFNGDTIMTWKPGSNDVTPLVTGPGEFDGAGLLNGRLYVSSKATNAIHALVGGQLVKMIEHVDDPADFEIDSKENRIAIPLTSSNRVEFHKLP